MSNAPYALARARFGYRLGDGTLIDLMTHDGLVSSFDGRHMVEQASFVSRELGISREEQDAWAFRSHQRAAAAIDAGRFDDEIVPVGELDGRREPAPRHLAREARRAPAALRPGRHDDRRQRARGQRRRLVRARRERGVGAATRDRAARDDPRAGLRRRRVRVPRAHPGAGRRASRSRGPGRRSTTSRASRSTRPSRRSRRTRRGCSASTRSA